MTLKNVQYAYAEDMTPEEKTELSITAKEGLIAIETRNPEIKRKAVLLKDGFVPYLWELGKERR